MTWWDAASDLLLGSACPGCGRPGWGVCESCRTTLGLVRRRWVGDLPVWSCGDYADELARMVRAWKDQGAWGATRVFSGELARLVGQVGLERAMLVPAPSRASAVRERGHDHAAALARGTARRLGWRAEPVLRRGRASRDQVGLGEEQRWSNLSRHLRAQPGSGSVVVVDDIVTSGATLSACAAALRAAGWTPVAAVTVASTPSRRPAGKSLLTCPDGRGVADIETTSG